MKMNKAILRNRKIVIFDKKKNLAAARVSSFFETRYIGDRFYSVKTTANSFVSQKIESVQFYSCPQAKLPTRLLSLSPRQTGIAHSFRTEFSEDVFS